MTAGRPSGSAGRRSSGPVRGGASTGRRPLLGAVVSSLIAAPLLAGCGWITGEGDPLQDLDRLLRSGQEWWKGASEQLDSLGSAIGEVLQGVRLSDIGDQVLLLCEAVAAHGDDPAALEPVARSLIEHATGSAPEAGQLDALLRVAVAQCPS